MLRAINLRQIETFKALIERGTVSRAAEAVAISQPAASKLLMHLESDTGLKLFNRQKGRLTPTAQALRLYEEIDRIFAGVRQVESAIDVVRRESQGRLIVGVLPALDGPLIYEATTNFLKRNPNVYCSIQSSASRWIAEGVLSRQIDVGVVTSRIENPTIVTESLLEHPLICIMPVGHPLAQLKVVRPKDLKGIPFVSNTSETYIGQKVAGLFEKHDVAPDVVLSASKGSTVCHFVAQGMGVSLTHPLFLAGMEDRLVARPFEPVTPFDFLLCFPRDARDAHLISDFVKETKSLATRFSQSLAKSWA